MSENLSSRQPMGPLSVGNVVSAGLRLYRDRFKLYFRLAFIGYLWVLVPIYGWAKYAAISGLISRLAFRELIERPETIHDARSSINPLLWSFFVVGILVTFILIGVNIAISLISNFIVYIPGVLINTTLGSNTTGSLLISLLQLLVNLASIAAQLWVQARFFVVELPIAVESNIDAVSTISRSWTLTSGSALRIQLVLLISFLITLPILAIALSPLLFIIPWLVVFSYSSTPEAIGLYILSGFIFIVLLIWVAGIFTMPFWQAIKAIVYYDLRSRREGLGMELHDSPSR